MNTLVSSFVFGSSAFLQKIMGFMHVLIKNLHKSLNEFEFQPDPTTNYIVNTSPCASGKKKQCKMLNTLASSFFI